MSISTLAPACRAGDRVAIVAPAGPFSHEHLLRGCALLRSWSLEPVFDPAIMARWGYLAGQDDLRARLLIEAWEDPSVRAILCARGGYGSMRLLERLPMADFAAHPKRFFGFSDITLLLNALAQESDLISFHSPMIASPLFFEGSPASQDTLKQALFGETLSDIYAPLSGRWVQGDRQTGRLLGGNLSLIASAIGTPWEIRDQRFLLLLEEVSEPPYRIDRMLQQLRYSGLLERVVGIALGDMGAYQDQYQRYSTQEMWLERLALSAGCALLCDLPIGHIDDHRSVPLGAWMTLDPQASSLRLATAEEIRNAQRSPS